MAMTDFSNDMFENKSKNRREIGVFVLVVVVVVRVVAVVVVVVIFFIHFDWICFVFLSFFRFGEHLFSIYFHSFSRSHMHDLSIQNYLYICIFFIFK